MKDPVLLFWWNEREIRESVPWSLKNFCIDGLHFVDDGNGDPENTYLNGKQEFYVASAQDSFRITGMGIIYLEHGVTLYNSDALSVHDNFIAECGNL